MSTPDQPQLSLFKDLADVRAPAQTIAGPAKSRQARKSKRQQHASVITAENDAIVLEPVECVRGATALAPNLPGTEVANVSAVTPIEIQPDEKDPGQIEAQVLRLRNSRADHLEAHSRENGNAFLKYAVLYLLAKAGILVLAKLELPQMDGTLVSLGLGIACAWYYSHMLTDALLAREHSYQFEMKFAEMSGWGKFATLLKWVTEACLFALFVVVAVWTIFDAISVAGAFLEYWQWVRGTTVNPP